MTSPRPDNILIKRVDTVLTGRVGQQAPTTRQLATNTYVTVFVSHDGGAVSMKCTGT